MNEEQLINLAVKNPVVAIVLTVLALSKVLGFFMENRRQRNDRGSNQTIIEQLKQQTDCLQENLKVQTDALKTLVESSTRQEGMLTALAGSQAGLTTNLAIAMTNQSNSSADIKSVRDSLPGVCKAKPK